MADIAAIAERISSESSGKDVLAETAEPQQMDSRDEDNKFQKAIAAWRCLSLQSFYV
jgi:hypothetical protein